MIPGNHCRCPVKPMNVPLRGTHVTREETCGMLDRLEVMWQSVKDYHARKPIGEKYHAAIRGLADSESSSFSTAREMVETFAGRFAEGERLGRVLHEMALEGSQEQMELHRHDVKGLVARFYTALGHVADLHLSVLNGASVAWESAEAEWADWYLEFASDLLLGPTRENWAERASKGGRAKARKPLYVAEKAIALEVLNSRTEKWRSKSEAVDAVVGRIQARPGCDPNANWEGLVSRWLRDDEVLAQAFRH